jgi:hypothetical protein
MIFLRFIARAWRVIVAVAIIIDKADDIITQVRNIFRNQEPDPPDE